MWTAYDGIKCWNGKRNPVTHVATVIASKRTVQPSSRFPLSKPIMTTKPEKIPSKLITTCKRVNIVNAIICFSGLSLVEMRDDFLAQLGGNLERFASHLG